MFSFITWKNKTANNCRLIKIIVECMNIENISTTYNHKEARENGNDQIRDTILIIHEKTK